MADVDINKFTTQILREGSTPSSPGFVVSEGQDPVNPPGTNNFVPYSGATSNVELGEFGLEAGFINLDTTPTGTPTTQGTIFWDADDETVDIILNGYTMKIGEDLFYPVKNQTGSTIAKGVAVRFAGTLGASGRLLIEPFIANGTVPSSRFMGVTAEEILNGDDGKVLYFGRVRGINTDAFNEGDILYASTTVAGGYQTAIPLPPNNIVEVAAVISKSPTVGTIFVRPTLGSNINTDEGVKITSVADKNLLQYQSGTSLWENKTLAQVLGGTSSQFVKGDGSLDSTSYGTGTVTSVGLSSATSGVTIGSSPVTTSGTITLAIATASGSQNGLLSSTDWTTFNSKQNALTNPVTGTGTTNYLPKFTGSTTIGNSQIFDNGTNVGIGTASPSANLEVYNAAQGNIYISSALGNASALRFFSGGNEYVTLRNLANGNFDIETGTGSPATRVRITSSGNVLIGTTTDNGAKLQVSGEGRFYQPLTNTTSYLTVENNRARNAAIRLKTTVGDFYLGTGIGADVNQFQIYDGNAGVNRLVISSSGNVGIGTASPAVSLEVNGRYRTTASFASSGTTVHEIYNASASGFGAYIAAAAGTNYSFRVADYLNNPLFSINGNGNVLIGTTTDSGHKLQVNGTALISSTYNNFQTSSKTASSGGTITFTYNTDYNLGSAGDNTGGLIIINVNEANTNANQANAVYIATIINPRGTGATITEISRRLGSGVTSLTVAESGNNITVTASISGGGNFRATLTFIGGSGIS